MACIYLVDLNRKCYQDDKVVELYDNKYYLDKPEIMLLYKFEDKLKLMNMLDIGVGGGRTTRYFAHRVNSYVGIDYSENMVEVCKKNFPDFKFIQCDARNMEIFEDNHFDLVLFSFNGIDYMAHDDRLKALQEIRRLCKKPGGIFFFSSHNLNYIPAVFSFKYSLDPVITVFNIYKYIKLRKKNKDIKYDVGHAIINDGAHNFRLSTYYVTPEEQIAQLNNVGFNNIKMYSLNSGTEMLLDETDQTPWIHYLCE
jgi:ubiquinone/menaquinone biosynthesis C-methylase UbiE